MKENRLYPVSYYYRVAVIYWYDLLCPSVVYTPNDACINPLRHLTIANDG